MPWRDVVNGERYVGDLVTFTVGNGEKERYKAAKLQPADPATPTVVPVLYEPVLVGFSTLSFRLRGFEAMGLGDPPQAVLQEWHCELP